MYSSGGSGSGSNSTPDRPLPNPPVTTATSSVMNESQSYDEIYVSSLNLSNSITFMTWQFLVFNCFCLKFIKIFY